MAIQILQLSSLEKIFLNDGGREDTLTKASALKGERFSYQIAFRSEGDVYKRQVYTAELEIPAFGGGTGTLSDPYRLYNARHFQNIESHQEDCFILMNDIVLPDSYAPISNFTGNLQGADKKITVNINQPSEEMCIRDRYTEWCITQSILHHLV